ncbi:MAG: DUF3419 family protein [Eudoraea sp.]|uniref:DUF3419 family protein n=1 Tax=Eudoraea sp. TaxID=1979955 RepID=UPI003C7428BC
MIFYSHVNEDSIPEHTMMTTASFSNMVTVAGSGERVIALMDHESLESIIIVDPNIEALYLTELKITALGLFSVSEYLFFIGYKSSLNDLDRKDLFSKVIKRLSKNCGIYWKTNLGIIIKGKLLLCGHFERFLYRVSLLMRFLFYSRIDSMMHYPYADWNGYEKSLWKILKKLFTYKMSYVLMGNKDPAFIHEDAELSYIIRAFQESFDKNEQLNSFFIQLLFKGNLQEMPKEALPNSLSEAFLTKVKKRLEQKKITMEYHQTDLLTYLQKEKEFERTFISTSDILSFELPKYMNTILGLVSKQNGDTSNHIVWRSFLKHRDFYNSPSNSTDLTIQDISQSDKTNMYKVYSMNF